MALFSIPSVPYENMYDRYLSTTKEENAIRKMKLENQYYGRNIESEMANRNSLTKGYDIANKFAPERLGLANKQAQQNLEWNPKNWQSENAFRNSQMRKINAEIPYIGRTAEADLIAKQIANRNAQIEYNREREFEKNFNNFTSGNGQARNTGNQQTNVNPSSHPSTGQNNTNEQIISPGSPNLYGADEWYEKNPSSRPLMEKKGLKKTQQIKIDKSGKSTIVTKYPSGKVTVSSINSNSTDENGIPLTTKMISQHQNVVASIDIAVPVLDRIIKMDDSDYSRFGGWTNKGAKYNATIKQGLDSVMGAFGLPQTNEGIKSILDQLEIGHNESPKEYRKRIEDLKKDLLGRQKYSSGLVKKAIKISGNENENDPYNLSDYDTSGER